MLRPLLSTAASLRPSAEDAIEAQYRIGAALCAHEAPELVERTIGPKEVPGPATRLAPSAEEARACQLPAALFDSQFAPESLETNTRSAVTAANFLPSADMAMDIQVVVGA